MHTFTGQRARLYEIGGQYKFRQAPLADCGGGWDWQAHEGLRRWTGEVSFEIWDGGAWEPIVAEAVFPRTGRVSFGRCLQGKHLRASGTCDTVSLAGEGGRWKLEVQTVVHMNPVMGSDVQQSIGAVGKSTAQICDVDVSLGRVFTCLDYGSMGSFVGSGTLLPGSEETILLFDDEGVVYEPA